MQSISKIARALLLTALTATTATAQTYPDKPVMLINPYAAGGPADILARTVAAAMKDTLGQTVVVDNKPGAGTAIGAGFVARANADGYTLFIGGSPSHVIAPALIKDARYDGVADFAFIATVGSVPNVLVVSTTKPWKNVKELVAAAKAGNLSAAHVGIGSIPQFLELLLQQRTGVKFTEVGYGGAAPAMIDLTPGLVDLGFINIPPLLGSIRDGKIRALAVANSTRSAQLPDVPTMAEEGFPDFEMSTWYGISAPAKTPKPVIDKLYAAVTDALKKPAVQQQLSSQGVEPFNKGKDEFLAYVKSDAAKMLPLIQAAGMKAQ
jgi:tripartite-type tricarboxylate transporter receptor subunit TctC